MIKNNFSLLSCALLIAQTTTIYATVLSKKEANNLKIEEEEVSSSMYFLSKVSCIENKEGLIYRYMFVEKGDIPTLDEILEHKEALSFLKRLEIDKKSIKRRVDTFTANEGYHCSFRRKFPSYNNESLIHIRTSLQKGGKIRKKNRREHKEVENSNNSNGNKKYTLSSEEHFYFCEGEVLLPIKDPGGRYEKLLEQSKEKVISHCQSGEDLVKEIQSKLKFITIVQDPLAIWYETMTRNCKRRNISSLSLKKVKKGYKFSYPDTTPKQAELFFNLLKQAKKVTLGLKEEKREYSLKAEANEESPKLPYILEYTLHYVKGLLIGGILEINENRRGISKKKTNNKLINQKNKSDSPCNIISLQKHNNNVCDQLFFNRPICCSITTVAVGGISLLTYYCLQLGS